MVGTYGDEECSRDGFADVHNAVHTIWVWSRQQES